MFSRVRTGNMYVRTSHFCVRTACNRVRTAGKCVRTSPNPEIMYVFGGRRGRNTGFFIKFTRMGVQEFLDDINRFEEKEARYAELYKGFSRKLPAELVKVVFDHLPELNNNRDENLKAVQNIAARYVGVLWDTFNLADGRNAQGGSVPDMKPVRKPQTKGEAENILKEEIKIIPVHQQKLYTKIFWELYDEQQAREQYQYAVFLKMKEVFVEFYMDDVLELESPYLRYFDRCLALDVCLFLEDVYELF